MYVYYTYDDTTTIQTNTISTNTYNKSKLVFQCLMRSDPKTVVGPMLTLLLIMILMLLITLLMLILPNT